MLLTSWNAVHQMLVLFFQFTYKTQTSLQYWRPYATVLHCFWNTFKFFNQNCLAPFLLLCVHCWRRRKTSFRESCGCSVHIDQQNCRNQYHSARVLFDNSPFTRTFELLKLFFLCNLFISFYCWALSFFSQTSYGLYKHTQGVLINLVTSVPQASLLNPAWGLLMTPIACNRDGM